MPLVEPGGITFANGKVLSYQPHIRIHSDPSLAREAGEPVWRAEVPQIIEGWRRVLLVREEAHIEGRTKTLSIYDWSGDQRGRSMDFIGRLFVLEPIERILLAQQSAYHVVDRSYILNIDAETVAEIPQSPNAFDFRISNDGRYFWMLSRHVRDGRPLTRALFLDGQGARLDNIDIFVERKWDVRAGGKTYRIHIDRPDFPG